MLTSLIVIMSCRREGGEKLQSGQLKAPTPSIVVSKGCRYIKNRFKFLAYFHPCQSGRAGQHVNGSTMTEEAKPDICVTKVTKSGYNGSDIVDSEGLKLSMLKHT